MDARGLFRFSLRDLLWLTVVAALAVALWIEHRNAVTARDERDKAHLYWDDVHEQHLERIRTMPPRPSGGLGGGRIGGGS
jgi:hypothetical protein